MGYETIIFDFAAGDHVATITINRPEVMNAFNQQMIDEFVDVWGTIREDDDVHAVVLRAAGERAFCTGLDVKERLAFPPNIWNHEDPGAGLSPKQQHVWKPVITAVHGMCAGGAMYWLNESDIVICSDDATFFDPHVTYGMTSALEPIGMAWTVPLLEVLRWSLLGLDERMSAERALEIGLVSEVVPRDQLWDRAHELASIIAAKPPAAIQGTVKAIWQSLDMTRNQALALGLQYTQLGNPIGEAQIDRATAKPREFRLR